jgi:hypothetical protein
MSTNYFLVKKTQKVGTIRFSIFQNLGNGMTMRMNISKMALSTSRFPDLIFFQPNFYVCATFFLVGGSIIIYFSPFSCDYYLISNFFAQLLTSL